MIECQRWMSLITPVSSSVSTRSISPPAPQACLLRSGALGVWPGPVRSLRGNSETLSYYKRCTRPWLTLKPSRRSCTSRATITRSASCKARRRTRALAVGDRYPCARGRDGPPSPPLAIQDPRCQRRSHERQNSRKVDSITLTQHHLTHWTGPHLLQMILNPLSLRGDSNGKRISRGQRALSPNPEVNGPAILIVHLVVIHCGVIRVVAIHCKG
jgi:hypothetical protein